MFLRGQRNDGGLEWWHDGFVGKMGRWRVGIYAEGKTYKFLLLIREGIFIFVWVESCGSS